MKFYCSYTSMDGFIKSLHYIIHIKSLNTDNLTILYSLKPNLID